MSCASIYGKTALWSEPATGAVGFGRVMFEAASRYWRVFGAGLSFFIVGVGGVLVFPVLNIVIPRRHSRMIVARHLIRFTFRCIVWLMGVFGVFHCDIRGLKRLERRGLLILANHPSLIDVVLLMAFVKRADCIVKRGLWRNPFTHATIRAAGYIRNDSGAGLMEDCITSLRSGSNLIVFPEGTRTPCDGSIRLKRGAANIAVRCSCNVTPVLIRCTPPVLGKGRQFLQGLSRSVHFSIEVREDIDIRPFIAQTGSDVLAARHLTDHLQDYFSKEKNCHAAA
jgi:1-acyl-sn-glycerol-3-phosphate acyltransferase